MPWGDGTGPLGTGPMTGRAGGFCAGFNVPGSANPIPGRGLGFGRGRGRGRGFGRGFWSRRGFGWGAVPNWGFAPQYAQAPDPYFRISAEEERQMLQNEAQYLRDSLANIEQRLKELEDREEKAQE